MKTQFLLSLAANAIRAVLGFVFFWQLSQAMELDSLGDYLFLISALGYFSTLIDFGFNLFVQNSVPRQKSNARLLLVRVSISKIALSAISSVILLILYCPLFYDQRFVLATLIIFTSLVVLSFSGVLLQFFKSLGRFDHELSSAALSGILPVAILAVMGEEVTLLSLAVLLLVVRLVVVILQLIMFRSITRNEPWRIVVPGVFNNIRNDLSSNFKYAAYTISGAIFLTIDLVVMRRVLGAEDVSIYATSIRVMMASILPFDVLSGVVIPRLAQQHSAEGEEFWSYVYWFAAIMMGGALVASAFLALFGKQAIILVFGEQFSVSGDMLAVLGVALVFRVAANVSGSILMVCGRQKQIARIMLVNLFSHVLLNVFMQEIYGVWGASYVMILSYILIFSLNLIVIVLSREEMRERPEEPFA